MLFHKIVFPLIENKIVLTPERFVSWFHVPKQLYSVDF